MKRFLFFVTLFSLMAIMVNAQWVEQATGFAAKSRGIKNISIVDANTVWVVASDGSGNNANVQEFSRTTDGGAHWTPGKIDVGNTSLGIAMISAVSASTAYVVAYTNSSSPNGQGIFITTDSGATWTRQTSADYQSSTSFANVVYFWDADTGFCMGDPAGGEFEIYTTTDGGANWTRVDGANIPNPLNGEYGYVGQYTVNGNNSIWFSTNKGRLFYSADRGHTWTVEQTPIADFGNGAAFAFIDDTTGLIVDPNNHLYGTTDNGANWTEISANGYYSIDLASVPGRRTFVSTGNDKGASFSNYNGLVWSQFTVPAGSQFINTQWLNDSVAWTGSFNTSDTVGGIFKFTGKIPEPFNNDLAVVDITNPVPGKIESSTEHVKVKVMNLGKNVQSSFDVSYQINGASVVTETCSTTLVSGETYEYTFSATEDFSHSGFYDIKAWTSLSGDEDVSNDTINKVPYLLDFLPRKAVVYEEGTGTWCGWCVRGHVGLKDMAHNHQDSTWIGIAVHDNDPMVVTEYDNAMKSLIGGYPSGVVNRRAGEVDPGDATLEDAYKNEVKIVPYAKVDLSSINWDADSRKIKVDVSATFGLDLTGTNYNLSLVIVEDSITGSGSGYDQANYYAAGGYDIVDWTGLNWKTLGNPIPASKMVYNHVARALVNGYNGVSGIVPADITSGQTYSYTFTYTLPDAYKAYHVKLVALLINHDTKVIENGIEKSLGVEAPSGDGIETNAMRQIAIYPNPVNDILIVENASGNQYHVFDLSGKEVLNGQFSSTTSVVNYSALKSGIYLMKIVGANTVSTYKIVKQ